MPEFPILILTGKNPSLMTNHFIRYNVDVALTLHLAFSDFWFHPCLMI